MKEENLKINSEFVKDSLMKMVLMKHCFRWLSFN